MSVNMVMRAAITAVAAGFIASARGEEPAAPAQKQYTTEDNVRWADERARIATAQDRRFAGEFMARADRAYRRGNYHRAWRDYNDAVPYYPHVRGFLMAANAGQRSWLLYGTRHRAAGQCVIRREHYVSQLRSDLAFRARVGLVLAARTPPRDAVEATLRRRVAAQTVCLEEIRRDHEPLPDAACIDAERLAACLGPPLLR